MNWPSIRPWLGSVARLVLGVVFLIAGWQKLHDPRAFLRAVRAYDSSPEWLSKAIAYGLPVLEVSLALLLIVGVVTRAAAAVTGLLLVVFLIGFIEVGARGIKLECGCFGGGGSTTGATSYLLDSLRDVGLLILAVYLVVWPMTRISIDEYLARNDQVAAPSAKRMRSEQGQRKYNAVLEARKREARTRSRYLMATMTILVVLISVIGIGVQSNRAKIQGTITATNASATNGVVLGKAAKVTIDVFEDFQCPYCQQFQASAGNDLDALYTAGKAQVRYHMVSFLDASSSGNRYSSRAANAALCASDISVEDFLKYHDYLYETGIQPTEGSNGRTDAQLITYAQKAFGLSGDAQTTFTSCLSGETHKALVLATTDNWSKRGLNGTPVVMVNGKSVAAANQTPTKAELDAAIAKVDPTATVGAKATAPTYPATSSAAASSGASSAAVATPTASP